jgi:hypothetical protein
MSRLLRLILIAGSVLVALAALGYAAHSMNLTGLLVTMHTPPAH